MFTLNLEIILENSQTEFKRESLLFYFFLLIQSRKLMQEEKERHSWMIKCTKNMHAADSSMLYAP